MGAMQNLPEEYKEIYSLNLLKDKKTAITVNIIAVVIAVIMVAAAAVAVSIHSFFEEENIGLVFLKIGVFFVGLIAYIALHELIHGITMKYFGTKKVKYGFNIAYAFAGSDDYYDKKSYIIIALAPVVVFAVVFALMNMLIGEAWFWVVYTLQITNISGAAGDFYVTAKFSKMPKDILVKDSGVSMLVYSKE